MKEIKLKPWFWLNPIKNIFTTYIINEKELIVQTGIFNRQRQNTQFARVRDLTVNESFFERILQGKGDIHLESKDPSTPNITLYNLNNVRKVEEVLRIILEQRGTLIVETYS